MAFQAVKVNNEGREAGGGAPSAIARPVNRLVGWFQRMREFLHEVRVELRLVTWPTRQDVISTTVVVIATVAFFGVFFLLVDSGIGYGVQRVFGLFKR